MLLPFTNNQQEVLENNIEQRKSVRHGTARLGTVVVVVVVVVVVSVVLLFCCSVVVLLLLLLGAINLSDSRSLHYQPKACADSSF